MRASALLFVLLTVVPFSRAEAGDPSKEEIVCALDPSCAAGERSHKRGLTVTGQDSSPNDYSVNLHINFAYNSAELLTDGRITLDRLGSALKDKRLDRFSFMIGGHTDAKGSDAFNQGLSERRAKTARDYLIQNYHISPARLETKGFGRLHLLNPSEPFDAVNRRVQIVNTSASARR
ncbi:MAG: hypothetical protein QOJ04_2088 [Caballeronia sp.]|nr:hypothetical protein [Caballeronia sp.]